MKCVDEYMEDPKKGDRRMNWETKLSRFIRYGLDEFPFPFNCMSLMILIIPAFVYYVINDVINYTQSRQEDQN